MLAVKSYQTNLFSVTRHISIALKILVYLEIINPLQDH